jgi:hypothetical protein
MAGGLSYMACDINRINTIFRDIVSREHFLLVGVEKSVGYVESDSVFSLQMTASWQPLRGDVRFATEHVNPYPYLLSDPEKHLGVFFVLLKT